MKKRTTVGRFKISTFHLAYPFLVSPAFERCLEETVGDFFRVFIGNEPRRNAEDVSVIVQSGKAGKLFIPAYRSPDIRMLVGGDCHAIAASTEQDAQTVPILRYAFRHRMGDIRIVGRVGSQDTEILYLKLIRGQPFLE